MEADTALKSDLFHPTDFVFWPWQSHSTSIVRIRTTRSSRSLAVTCLVKQKLSLFYYLSNVVPFLS